MTWRTCSSTETNISAVRADELAAGRGGTQSVDRLTMSSGVDEPQAHAFVRRKDEFR